jgi:hypothetical protein
LGAVNPGDGGLTEIAGGTAGVGGGGDANGGNVTVTGGAGAGTGLGGDVVIDSGTGGTPGVVEIGTTTAVVIASGNGTTEWTHDGVLKGRVEITTDANTAIGTTDANNGQVVRCTAATTVTVTVPDGLTPGVSVEYVQEGAGQVQVVSNGVVLLHVPSTYDQDPGDGAAYTAEQWSSIVITVLASGDVLVRGDLAVA